MRSPGICLYFFLIAPVFAQVGFVTNGTTVAVSGPVFQTSVGYTYLAMDTLSRQRVSLSGMDVNGLVDFNPRWGIVTDSSYARLGNVLATGHSGNILSCLTGPAFYPVQYGKTRIFVHSLAGASLVDSAVPVRGTYFLEGTVMRFSYAIGGGIEHSFVGPFALRFGADYLRTTFANSSAAMQFQNNLRIVTSLAYRFGNR